MIPKPHLEDRSAPVGWLLVALAAAAILAGPHSVSGDGGERWTFLRTMLEQGRVVPRRYSAIQPVLAIPLYGVGKLLELLHVVRPHEVVSLFSGLVLLAGLALVARLLRPRAGDAWVRTFLLLILTASMFPHHAQFFYGELFTAVAVLVGLVLVQEGREVAGGLCLALGTANTPAALVGAGLVAVDRIRSGEGKLRAVWPLLAAAALVGLDNWIQHGGPLSTGYDGDHGQPTVLPYSGLSGFSYPLVLGVVSLLVSPGKGLLFFAPGLLLLPTSVRGELPDPLAVLLRRSLWFLAGLLVVYGRWWSWYGGWFWGPRFLLFGAVPAAMLLASALVQRPLQAGRAGRTALVLGLLLWSTWVGIDGAAFGQGNMDACQANDYALEHLCWYVPEFSALFRPFVAWPGMQAMGWVFGAVALLVAGFLAAPLVAALRGGAAPEDDGGSSLAKSA